MKSLVFANKLSSSNISKTPQEKEKKKINKSSTFKFYQSSTLRNQLTIETGKLHNDLKEKLLKKHIKNKLSLKIKVLNQSKEVKNSKKNLHVLRTKKETKKDEVVSKQVVIFKPKMHFSQKNISYVADRLKKLKTHDRSKTGLSNAFQDKNLFENIEIKEDLKREFYKKKKKSINIVSKGEQKENKKSV